MAKAKSNIERLMEPQRAQVQKEWGDQEKLGKRLYRALLAERLVLILAAQDDDMVRDDTVRRILAEGWSWIVAEVEDG